MFTEIARSRHAFTLFAFDDFPWSPWAFGWNVETPFSSHLVVGTQRDGAVGLGAFFNAHSVRPLLDLEKRQLKTVMDRTGVHMQHLGLPRNVGSSMKAHSIARADVSVTELINRARCPGIVRIVETVLCTEVRAGASKPR